MSHKTLTRADLAQAVYPFVRSRREATALVGQVLDEVAETLSRGESIKLSSFGVFAVRAKAERTGRNPKTGEAAPISARRVVVFRPSKVLSGRLVDQAGEPGQEDRRRPGPRS